MVLDSRHDPDDASTSSQIARCNIGRWLFVGVVVGRVDRLGQGERGRKASRAGSVEAPRTVKSG